MDAAILQKPRFFQVQDLPTPELGDDEILVRAKMCGICTGELDMWEGKATGIQFPLFIGHEPAGVVEAVGRKVKELQIGDHVAVWSEGKGYARQFVSKEAYAYRLDKNTKFELALGEPIACSVNGVRKADPQLNDSVCIVGCGFMGLIMLQVFKARGVGNLIAVDTRESILSIARSLGATHTLNPKNENVKQAVKDLTNGRGVDIGVEGAGLQATLDLAADITRMEGKLEVFGFHQGEPRRVHWGYWNWMAFQIINGHTRSAHIYVEGMRIGLRMLETGKLNMEPLVTHQFPLTEINEGFEIASAKKEGFVKAVVTM